jgi:hypothetical protein
MIRAGNYGDTPVIPFYGLAAFGFRWREKSQNYLSDKQKIC